MDAFSQKCMGLPSVELLAHRSKLLCPFISEKTYQQKTRQTNNIPETCFAMPFFEVQRSKTQKSHHGDTVLQNTHVRHGTVVTSQTEGDWPPALHGIMVDIPHSFCLVRCGRIKCPKRLGTAKSEYQKTCPELFGVITIHCDNPVPSTIFAGNSS